MLAKRIIPCLDVREGKVVKGVNFVDLQVVGDAVELGKRYRDEGADELVFLDITATVEGKKARASLVKEIARHLDIPFTVGGGVDCARDVDDLLNAGADKISVNSAAVADPGLIDRLAANFGSQCVVVAMDVKRVDGDFRVFVHGGRTATHRDAVEWAEEVVDRGAGEILLTSMDRDGTGEGFDTDLVSRVSGKVQCPVIASGGGGRVEDFLDAFVQGKADAVLAAGVFHSRRLPIDTLKAYLAGRGIIVRRNQ